MQYMRYITLLNWKTAGFKSNFYADPHAMTIFMDDFNHFEYFWGSYWKRNLSINKFIDIFERFLSKIIEKVIM